MQLLLQWWGYEELFLAVKTKGLEVAGLSYICIKQKKPMDPDNLRIVHMQRGTGLLTVIIHKEKAWDTKSKVEFLKQRRFDYFVLFMTAKMFTLQMTKEGGKTIRN